MCELPECSNNATVAIISWSPKGNMVITHSCESCSMGMDDAQEGIELVDIGAVAVGQELGIDILEVYEAKLGQQELSYADLMAQLGGIKQ